jgi:hypothetical protein
MIKVHIKYRILHNRINGVMVIVLASSAASSLAKGYERIVTLG